MRRRRTSVFMMVDSIRWCWTSRAGSYSSGGLGAADDGVLECWEEQRAKRVVLRSITLLLHYFHSANRAFLCLSDGTRNSTRGAGLGEIAAQKHSAPE